MYELRVALALMLKARATSLTFTAAPPEGTVRVRWYMDGKWRRTDSTAPFTYSPDPSLWQMPSRREITAKYFDANDVKLS